LKEDSLEKVDDLYATIVEGEGEFDTTVQESVNKIDQTVTT